MRFLQYLNEISFRSHVIDKDGNALSNADREWHTAFYTEIIRRKYLYGN